MALAHPMSLGPWRDCHPARKRQARQQFLMVIPIPIPELASEYAFGSRKGGGGKIERTKVPSFSFPLHQLSSFSISLSGRCGMNGHLAHMASMLSSPMR